jgi:hypothetical protein
MSNLHKETPAIRQEVLNKAGAVGSLYNKGGLQVAVPFDDKKL